MALSLRELDKLREVLIKSLRNKFKNYKPETSYMPFHTRLLGKDRVALFSFIHSLNTNFGTTIFEPIAIAIAESNFKSASSQQSAGSYISSEAHKVIQNIIDSLATADAFPNKIEEIDAIRTVANKGVINKVKLTKIDIKLVDHNGTIHFFDLKTAKPNAGGFKEFKRTLLEWVAATLVENRDLAVNSYIAIPYNPYHPKPYNRWTMRGMIDLEHELKVAEEFWDFLGGEGCYIQLLDLFEEVGVQLRPEIDAYFDNFNK